MVMTQDGIGLVKCELLPFRSMVFPNRLVADENSHFLEPEKNSFCGPCDHVINEGGEICDCRACVSESRDCTDVMNKGFIQSGIYPINDKSLTFDVFCYMDAGRAWMVFQRRFNGKTVFWNKTWLEYKEGFGNLREEFWLG